MYHSIKTSPKSVILPDSELQHFRHQKLDSDPESVGDWSSFSVAAEVDSWRAVPVAVGSADKADVVAVGIRVERACVEVTEWVLHTQLPCCEGLSEEEMEL